MKILKFILAFVAILLLVFVIFSFLGPKDYKVDVSRSIQANDSIVYSYIANFNKWESWSAWAEKDPEAKYTVSGPDGQVGTIQSWKGTTSGEGSMEILEAIPNSKVATQLRFVAPRENEATVIFTIKPLGAEQSEVNWHMEGDIGFMGRAYMYFNSMEKIISPDFERGLFKLDSLATSDQNIISTMPES